MYILAFTNVLLNNNKSRELHKIIKKRIDNNRNIKKIHGIDSKEYKESDKILKDLQKKYIESINVNDDDEDNFDFN